MNVNKCSNMKRCECGMEMFSGNLARHKGSASCTLNKQNDCVEIIIEPELLASLASAGIDLKDVVDVQEQIVQISAKWIPNSNGCMEMNMYH